MLPSTKKQVLSVSRKREHCTSPKYHKITDEFHISFLQNSLSISGIPVGYQLMLYHFFKVIGVFFISSVVGGAWFRSALWASCRFLMYCDIASNSSGILFGGATLKCLKKLLFFIKRNNSSVSRRVAWLLICSASRSSLLFLRYLTCFLISLVSDLYVSDPLSSTDLLSNNSLRRSSSLKFELVLTCFCF